MKPSTSKAYALLDVILAVTVFAIWGTGVVTFLQKISDTSNSYSRDHLIQYGLESILTEARHRPVEETRHGILRFRPGGDLPHEPAATGGTCPMPTEAPFPTSTVSPRPPPSATTAASRSRRRKSMSTSRSKMKVSQKKSCAYRTSGFSLFEVVIALTVFSLLGGTVFAILWRAADTAAEIRNYDMRDEQVSRFLGMMRQTIESLPQGGAIELTPPEETGSGFYEMTISGSATAFDFGGTSSPLTGDTTIGLSPRWPDVEKGEL